jgi:hypothetical protein
MEYKKKIAKSNHLRALKRKAGQKADRIIKMANKIDRCLALVQETDEAWDFNN